MGRVPSYTVSKQVNAMRLTGGECYLTKGSHLNIGSSVEKINSLLESSIFSFLIWLSGTHSHPASLPPSALLSRCAPEGDHHKMSISRLIKDHRPNAHYYHELYRELHQDPELGLQERQTAARVAKSLSRLDALQVKTGIGGHGVVGILRNGTGPTVLLRAELDALPVLEHTGWEFASVKHMTDMTDGITKPVMHACGHDLHMTSLLLAMETLHSCRKHWRGTITALFQPNEETGRGAQAMVDGGLYDAHRHHVPLPGVVLGGHSMPERAGRVRTRIGVFNGAATGLRVTLYGRGAHGARPHMAVDPVVLGSSTVMKLQTIVSRETNPLDSAVVTVGSIQAGHTANVIPEHAVLHISVRALDEALQARILAAVKRVVRAECTAMGAPKEPLFEETSAFPVLANDTDTTTLVSDAFKAHFHNEYDCDAPISMGAEDMANLARPASAQCCFWTFGCIDAKIWDTAHEKGSTGEEVHGRQKCLIFATQQLTSQLIQVIIVHISLQCSSHL